MRTLFTTFFALALCVVGVGIEPVQAQDDEDFTLLRFRGGVANIDLRAGLNLIGGGLGAGTMGGVISPSISNDASSLFTNPAGLGLLTNRQITINAKAGIGNELLGIDLVDTFDLQQEVETQTDDALAELNFPSGNTPIYTNINELNIRQVGQLGSLSLAFPVYKSLVASIGAHYPMDFTYNARVSGIETLLDAARQSGDQEIDIKFGANMSVLSNVGIRMSTLSFGLAGSLAEGSYGRVAAGFALNRYSANAFLNLNVEPDALIILSRSTEYYFNDPNDPNLSEGETNQLYLRAKGNYSSAEWGSRIGVYYQTPLENIAVSLVYNSVPDFEMKDPNAFAESYLPAFVNLDGELEPAEGEEDLLNVANIDIAKPNLTEQTSDSLGQTIRMDVPSSLTFGVDLGLGPHTVALNYVQYFGDLAYTVTYDDTYRLGKSTTSGIRFGVDLQFPDRVKGASWALIPLRILFLDFDGFLFQALGKYTKYSDPHYRFGGGVFLGDGIVEGFDDEELSQDIRDILDLPTPNGWSMGRQYTLFDTMDIGVMVFSFPDVAFRVGATYNFR